MADQIGSGFSDLVTTIKNCLAQLGTIAKAVANAFPQVTGTAGTATGGAATLPANPVGFITITLPNGTAARVPYYT